VQFRLISTRKETKKTEPPRPKAETSGEGEQSTGLSKPIESSLLEAVKKVKSELDNVELLINRLSEQTPGARSLSCSLWTSDDGVHRGR